MIRSSSVVEGARDSDVAEASSNPVLEVIESGGGGALIRSEELTCTRIDHDLS